jgi:hypothetical protein
MPCPFSRNILRPKLPCICLESAMYERTRRNLLLTFVVLLHLLHANDQERQSHVHMLLSQRTHFMSLVAPLET